MIQTTQTNTCGFTDGAFTCTLPAGHPGDHYGRFSAEPPAPDNSVLHATFGKLISGQRSGESFYGLGDGQFVFPAALVDRALAVIRLSEKWHERDWLDLVEEMNSSEYLPGVVHDFLNGSTEAGDDVSGKAYYTAQFAMRLLQAGYLAGRWDEEAAQ